MSEFELTVLAGDRVVQVVGLGEVPLRIGRAPSNDLVIDDDSVSGHHAHVWVEGPRAWLQDLASRNGTWLNDERVRGPSPITSGDRIRIGERVQLRLRGGEPMNRVRMLQVKDLDFGLLFPLRSDRFHIGSGPDAHLRVPDTPNRVATIGLGADGELWIGTDEGQSPLGVGAEFHVAGRRLVVVETTMSHAPTIEFGSHRYPYEATIDFDGPSGPQALLVDPKAGSRLLLTRNRGLLMCLLARQVRTDRLASTSAEDEGWCNDSEVAVQIWGRSGADANKLHVLIHRLRKAVEDAGFDPWFIEKRQWGVRARLRHVEDQS